MIISQTPIRVSLFGGGTDFADFYRQEGGAVLTTAIDKYIYVIVKERFDDQIRVGYTKTEVVDSVDEVQHDLVREALRLTGIDRRLEVVTVADIPSRGSGLGASSTVTVGVLNAMFTYLGESVAAETLAQMACRIEIEVLGRPIGVQDQYIAAYGGLRYITFHASGEVTTEVVRVNTATRRKLDQNLMLFYTGIERQASDVLTEQKANINGRRAVLRQMKALALQGRELLEAGQVDDLGALLHEGWLLKRKMASKISNATIDDIYDTARRAGALGGKVSGAGGGGFVLVYVPFDAQEPVRAALHGLRELPFRAEHFGSRIVLNYRRYNNE